MSLDQGIVNTHTEQIENLRKEIEEKEEAISKLNKDVEKLQEQNDELTFTVESKNKEVQALGLKIDQLEKEKKALGMKLRNVEAELEDVRKEVVELKESNKINESKNVTLEANVNKLSKKMDCVKKSLEETRSENTSLKKEVKNIQEAVQHKTLSWASERMAVLPYLSDLEVERASIVLGELCWQIQAMMYQDVHPNRYRERKSYKVKYIEEDIDEVEDERHQSEAKRRWDALKSKLNWKKTRHARAMKSIQDRRNPTAHPELSEELLVNSAALMKRKGKLTDWHNPDCVEELIEMWKQLKQQQ